MTRSIILNFLSEHKEEFYAKYGVTKMGLFGSYARDEQNDNSDIDIAVEIESKNKFRSFFGLKHYIEDNLYHKIDLGIESSLKPVSRKYIEKEIIYV